ncbi:MAG TPA: tRNA (adenosine(37)-N6)-threonylcarbamoyltransferase complex ATPase subunit type 1 TsaE [Steroidobacteraceae bacterium]|nr:tRNA (adenosine(37)-N6)-threonylcarbamoyltransferase complex ATPase subunit type 1 TsaE [Steroidobacteraceae bacterium]
MTRLTFDLPDAGATDELGRALALAFPGGAAAPLVVHLSGEIGAGKTSLIRAFLRSCGVTGAIRSPTYTLVETHRAGAAIFVHVDLYRLGGAGRGGGALDDLALREQLQPGRTILIEWPEHAVGALPPADLAIAIEDHDGGRRALLASRGAVGDAWLRLLASNGNIIPYLSNLT